MNAFKYAILTILLVGSFSATAWSQYDTDPTNDVYCETMNKYGYPCDYDEWKGPGAHVMGLVATQGIVEDDDGMWIWCKYPQNTEETPCEEVIHVWPSSNGETIVPMTAEEYMFYINGGNVDTDIANTNLDGVNSLLVRMNGDQVGAIIDSTDGYFALKTGYFVPRDFAISEGMVPDDWETMTTTKDLHTFLMLRPTYVDKVWSPIVGAVMSTISNGAAGTTVRRTNERGGYVMPYGFYEELKIKCYFCYGVMSLTAVMMGAMYPIEISLGNTCTYFPNVPVYADVAYGNFNPRSKGPKLFTAVREGDSCNTLETINFAIDVINVNGTLCMTNDTAATSCEGELVPVGDEPTEFYPGPTDGTVEDLNKDAGFVRKLYTADFRDTDLYVFRSSTGELMAARNKLPENEMAKNADSAKAEFQAIIRGRQRIWKKMGANLFTHTLSMTEGAIGESGEVEWDVQTPNSVVRTDEDGKYLAFAKQSLRNGERAKLVAINRSTGYIGTLEGVVKQPSPGSTLAIDFKDKDLVMRPPNLMVDVRRAPEGQDATACENAEENGSSIVYKIGHKGSGLVQDACLMVQTEWRDQDGSPLPDGLPGFTGRIARLGAEESPNGHFLNTSVLEDSMAHFGIQPGKHTQLFKISDNSQADIGHYYIHVDGAAGDDFANFRSSSNDDPSFSIDRTSHGESRDDNEHEKYLRYRPADFVPFKVRNTQAANEAGYGEIWYRYRPEMQFSLLSLDNVSVDAADENGDPIDASTFINNPGALDPDSGAQEVSSVVLTYELLQDEEDYDLPDDFDTPLKNSDGDLVFEMLGYEPQSAVFGDGADEEYEHAVWDMPGMDMETLLTLKLIESHDPGNVLWDLNPPLLDIKLRGNRTSIPNGENDVAYIVESTGDVEFQSVKWEIAHMEEGVIAFFDETYVADQEKKVEAGEESLAGCIVLKATAVCAPDESCKELTAFKVIKIGCECADCPDDVALGSIDFEIRMGLSDKGGRAGVIRIKETNLDTVASPKSLEVISQGAYLRTIRDDNDVIRQVQSPYKTADIEVLTENSYKIAVFDNQFVTGVITSGWQTRFTFTSPNDADAVWTISKIGNNELRLQKQSQGMLEEYRYLLDSDVWRLIKGYGDAVHREVESREELNAGEYLIKREIQDANGNAVSRTIERLQRLFKSGTPWGEVVVERTEGISSDEKQPSVMTYVTSGANTGKLSRQQNPDGSWTSYQYNSTTGKLTSQTHVWLDGGSEQTAGKITHYFYHSSDAHADKYARIIEMAPDETVLSETVFDYQGTEENGYTEISGQCANPGCTLNNADTLRTITDYYPLNYPSKEGEVEAPSSGQIKRIVHPDGRVDYYTYKPADENTLAPRAGGKFVYRTVTHDILDGSGYGVPLKTTREVTISNEVGNTISEYQYLWTGSAYVLLSETKHYYDDDNHLVKSVHSNGTQTESMYGCCGQTSTTDILGIQTNYAYDALRRIKQTTRAGVAGQDDIITTYTYDAAGRQISSTVSAGMLKQTTYTTYDSLGRTVSTTDAAGLVTKYEYPDELTTVTILPGGATQISSRYVDGRTKSETGTAGVSRYYTYTTANGLQCTTVRTGAVDSPAYQKDCVNMLGQSVYSEQPATDGNVLVTTSEYNAAGQLIRTSSTGMADTLYEYNQLGEQVRSGQDVDGNGVLDAGSNDRISESESTYKLSAGKWWVEQQSFTYPEAGADTRKLLGRQMSQASGFAGGVVAESHSFDVLGNETVSATVLDASAHSETHTVKYPDSIVAETTVSVGGRAVSQTSKDGITTEYLYDSLGRTTGVVDPRTGTSVTHYNDQGQVDWAKDAAGFKTEFEYDAATGRKILERNALGYVTRFAYNERGEMTHTWGDAAYPVQYVYDDFGRRYEMVTFQDGDFTGEEFPAGVTGNVTRWHYDDASGMLLAKEDAAGEQVQYTYDAAGKLKTRVWAANGTTTYGYDNATGEMLSVDYSDDTPDLGFTYDRLGRQKTVTDAVGSRTFYYDPDSLQQVAEEISGIYNETLYRKYDALGRADSISLGAEYNVDYGYDELGRFAMVDYGDDTAVYSYVPDSALLSGMQTSVVQTSYSYEPKRNVKTAVENRTGETVVSRYEYAYDSIGRRTSMKQSGSAFFVEGDAFNKYGYNPRNEVIGSNHYLGNDLANTSSEVTTQAQDYNYDPIGNRQTANAAATGGEATYEANALNQYTTINDGALTYDLDGNLTSFENRAVAFGEGGQTTMTYNAENRLVAVTTGTTRLEFTYDYMGRRVLKKKLEDGTLQETRHFTYDGWNLIDEEVQDETDNVVDTKQYVWGLDLSQSLQGAGGVGGLLAVVDGENVHQYMFDANGNVGQLVSGEDGTVAARYEYDAFGNAVVAVGDAALENAYRFSTKYLDETGMYYYGYRYYLGDLGRWNRRDPKEDDGNNLIAFVGNNAITQIDYLGLSRINILAKVWDFIVPRLSAGKDWSFPVLTWPVPGGFLVIHIYGTVSAKICCDRNRNRKNFAIDAIAGIEGFYQIGYDKKVDVIRNKWGYPILEGTKTSPRKGYRDRDYHGDISSSKAICPLKKNGVFSLNIGDVGWVQPSNFEGSVFIRGSAGIYWGKQLSAQIPITIQDIRNFEPKKLIKKAEITGSYSRGIYGASLELGLSVSFRLVGKAELNLP
ncbi:MAG: RHS repeat protein [Deltaproteobacteria bacterium]|nr:RHS repeat protein [Deltaproteobacteria bacterium]